MLSDRDFSSTLLDGAQAEDYIEQYFKKMNCNIQSVAGDVRYQKKDIDFLIDFGNGIVYTLEIKGDQIMYKTGNVYIEESHVRTKADGSSLCTNGWLYYSEADILGFFDVVTYRLYMINWQALREAIITKELYREYRRATRNKIDHCTTAGYCIPTAVLIENGYIYQVIDTKG